MDEKEGLVPNWMERIFGEIQGVLALSYVLLIVIGMINEAVYFSYFDINIFEYSVIFDFLIAPFKKLEYLFLLLFTFSVSMLAYWLDVWSSRKMPKMYYWMSFGLKNKSWYSWYRVVIMVLVFFFMLIVYSNEFRQRRHERIYESSEFDTEVILDTEKSKTIIGNKIGSNSNYLFILDQEKVIRIIPIHSKVEQVVIR